MSCDSNCSSVTLNQGAIGPQGPAGDGWTSGAGAPSGSPTDNEIHYFDTTNGAVYIWNGSSWVKEFEFTGTAGVFGGYSQEFSFSSTTTAGTAAGQLRFNNGTPASVTNIYVNDADTNGAANAFSSLGVGDKIRVFTESDSTIYALFTVVTNTYVGSSYYNIEVTYDTGNGTFSNGADVVLTGTFLSGLSEDQTHALSTFTRTTNAPNAIPTVTGTGTIGNSTYTIDTDNANATIFQNTYDKFEVNIFAEAIGNSTTTNLILDINGTSAVTAVFYEKDISIEAEIIRISDISVDVIYKVFQTGTLQSTGRTTVSVTDMTGADLTISLKCGAHSKNYDVEYFGVKHVKYTSTTF